MPLLEKISTQEKLDFIKNMMLLVRSGKPVNESFGLLSEQTKSPVLSKSLLEAKEKAEKGLPIHEILDQNPNFDKIFVSFIRAGEESGTLGESLEYLASWLERSNRLKKEISSATLYPKIIVIFASLLGLLLSIFILPQLIPVFTSLGGELPLPTRILLYISELMQNSGVYIVASILAFLVMFYFILKLRPVRRIWDRMMLNLPIFGTMAKEYQLTIISQLITTLFRSGLTINTSLEIISESVTNVIYEEALDEIKIRVAKGTSLAQTIKDYPDLFPPVFVSVVYTGEETGSYSQSFEYLSDFFASSVSDKSQRLPTILEPLLLILIGFFVLFIAGALILPIYELMDTI